jgi:hypothetical protein
MASLPSLCKNVPQVQDFFQHFAQNVSIMWNNVIDSFHHSAAHKPTDQGLGVRASGAAAAASIGALPALRG